MFPPLSVISAWSWISYRFWVRCAQLALDFVLAYLLIKLFKCTSKLRQFSKKKSNLQAWFPPRAGWVIKINLSHFNSQHTPHIRDWYCSPSLSFHPKVTPSSHLKKETAQGLIQLNICTFNKRTEPLSRYRGELYQDLPKDLLRSSYEHGLQR